MLDPARYLEPSLWNGRFDGITRFSIDYDPGLGDACQLSHRSISEIDGSLRGDAPSILILEGPIGTTVCAKLHYQRKDIHLGFHYLLSSLKQLDNPLEARCDWVMREVRGNAAQRRDFARLSLLARPLSVLLSSLVCFPRGECWYPGNFKMLCVFPFKYPIVFLSIISKDGGDIKSGRAGKGHCVQFRSSN